MDNQPNYRTIQRLNDGKYYATFNAEKWFDQPVSVFSESTEGCKALNKHLTICKEAGYVVSVVAVTINESEFM